jgi:hypothetical protein
MVPVLLEATGFEMQLNVTLSVLTSDSQKCVAKIGARTAISAPREDHFQPFPAGDVQRSVRITAFLPNLPQLRLCDANAGLTNCEPTWLRDRVIRDLQRSRALNHRHH